MKTRLVIALACVTIGLLGLSACGGDDGGTTTPPGSGSVADLLAQADEKFTEAEQALRDGDLAAYQLAIDEARDLVAEAAEAAGQEADGATTTSTTATIWPPSCPG